MSDKHWFMLAELVAVVAWLFWMTENVNAGMVMLAFLGLGYMEGTRE